MPAAATSSDSDSKPNSTLATLVAARVVGVLRAPSAARAIELAESAIAAGLQAIEVTFTVPDAADVIAELQHSGRQLVVGAGTVSSPAEAETAVSAGATFLVSPHFDPEVMKAARSLGVPYVPGALTPSEVFAAGRATGGTGGSGGNSGMVKVFPVARLGGAKYVADLLGPYPALQLMVTGGVSLATAADYLAAGAEVVGIGSLFGMAPEELGSGLAALLE